jgi:Sulfatase-modifying factor enzyme 1
MWAISSQEPRIPPNLPAPFDEVVRGCLVRDHRARWSAARVLDAIRASQPGAFSSVASTKRHTVIESLPVPPRQKTAPAAPRPAGPPPAAPTPRKAWPWLFAVLAVCTVAAAVVWVWHPWRSATSAGGAGSQQPSYPKPRIDTLTVEPANIYKGQTATMRWSTSDATVVSFDPGIGQVQSSGSVPISPDHTTQYTLTATGPGGTQTRSVRLDVSTPEVSGPPSPVTPKVNLKDSQTYVWIPPGRFAMGCSEGDADCFPIEKPSHEVTIAKGFWMGNTEVTQEAFEHVMGTNPSYFKGGSTARGAGHLVRSEGLLRSCGVAAADGGRMGVCGACGQRRVEIRRSVWCGMVLRTQRLKDARGWEEAPQQLGAPRHAGQRLRMGRGLVRVQVSRGAANRSGGENRRLVPQSRRAGRILVRRRSEGCSRIVSRRRRPREAVQLHRLPLRG